MNTVHRLVRALAFSTFILAAGFLLLLHAAFREEPNSHHIGGMT